MNHHWHVMHELVASRHGDLIRAAEAHRLAAAVLGAPSPVPPAVARGPVRRAGPTDSARAGPRPLT
jgi:hypothetical protein